MSDVVERARALLAARDALPDGSSCYLDCPMADECPTCNLAHAALDGLLAELADEVRRLRDRVERFEADAEADRWRSD